MKVTKVVCLLAILLLAISVSSRHATAMPAIEITNDEKISVSVENGNVNEMLRIMSEKNLFEMKGPAPGSEALTLNFSKLSLEEALKKIMRGYNYVLIRQGESRKPLLVVMGKAERTKYTDQPAPAARPATQPAQPAARAANAHQAADTRSYVPPSTLPQTPPTPEPPRPSRTPAAAHVAGPAGRAPGPGAPAVAAGTDQKEPQQQQAQDKKPGAGQEPQPASPKPAQPDLPQGWPRMSGVSTRDVLAPLMPR